MKIVGKETEVEALLSSMGIQVEERGNFVEKGPNVFDLVVAMSYRLPIRFPRQSTCGGDIDGVVDSMIATRPGDKRRTDYILFVFSPSQNRFFVIEYDADRRGGQVWTVVQKEKKD